MNSPLNGGVDRDGGGYARLSHYSHDESMLYLEARLGMFHCVSLCKWKGRAFGFRLSLATPPRERTGSSFVALHFLVQSVYVRGILRCQPKGI